MLSIAHTLTGTIIATKTQSPYLAIPLILTSHYLLDAIAHWDAGTGLSNGSKSIKTALLMELPDLILALILVLIYFPLKHLPHSLIEIIQLPQVWGSFFALLPDFLEAPRNFLHYEPPWLKLINRFHHSFHHSIPKIIDGLAPQLILLILIWLIR